VKDLPCPFCGPRALREFEFHKTLADNPAGSACEQVYERVARLELSAEHWQHVQGCRTWLLVHRNPSTGEVIDVRMLGGQSP
jgi:methylglutamate dehydrogenase subunit B